MVSSLLPEGYQIRPRGEVPIMKDFRQLLDQQLRKLEAEQELIDQAITEIRRRQGVLEEIAGWNPAEEEAEPAQAQESENHSGEPEWAMSITEKAW